MKYYRRTLNCGHLDLVQAKAEDRPLMRLGTLTACWVCPKRPEGGYPRGHGIPEVATVRQIVKIEEIDLAAHPQSPDQEWWYW